MLNVYQPFEKYKCIMEQEARRIPSNLEMEEVRAVRVFVCDQMFGAPRFEDELQKTLLQFCFSGIARE